MNVKEYKKLWQTCGAKFNLIFVSDVDLNNLKITPFALARNYAEFCYLDMQRVLFMLFSKDDEEIDAELEKKLDALDKFLTVVLKEIDGQS